MGSPLRLYLKDEDPWHVSKTASDILIAYLNDPGSPLPAEVANRLDELSPQKRQIPDGEGAEEPTSFLLEFWETFLGIARQVPFDHSAQARMVALVKALGDLPTPSDKPGRSIWFGFSELSNSIRFVWKEPSDLEDTFEPFMEWVNLNSLVARLVGNGILVNDWSFGIWAICWSLEYTEEPTRDGLESRIGTAAQWMQYNSQGLLSILKDTDRSEEEKRVYGSTMFKGDKVFSMDRWNFWKSKLTESSRFIISEKIKLAASEAVEAMENAERGSTGGDLR